jgi:MFS family permease
VRIRLRLLVGAAVGFGAAEIVAGVMPTYVAFAVMCPVIGLCSLTMLNSANSTMQLESAPDLRGRVMALYMTIVMGGTPIGSPIIGWVGQHFGARWTLVGGGLLTILGVALAVALFARPSRAAAEAAAAAEPESVDARAA